MAVLACLLVGVVAGVLARSTMPAGIMITLMLGMAGAIKDAGPNSGPASHF